MVDPHHNAPARVRPREVTISSYLLMFYAALALLGLIVALTTIGTVQDVYSDAYAGSDMEGTEGVIAVVGIGAGVVSLLFAIGLVVLALLNMRGKNGARITTWVVGGIALCCTGFGLLGSSLGNSMGGQTSGDVPSQEEIQRRVEDALPSWYGPVNTLLGVLSVLALLAALILLALPKANEFFRKQQQGWEPPVPGASYPGHPQASGEPGYPQTPGYPQSSGEPGYPPPPGQPGTGSASGGPEQPGTDRPGQNPPPVS
ncbi:hypothetical protein [Micromonospora endolithica]|uniref:hypothetical protein n=1 Tax=Micromonospora endolithica TaxID=230091 RepID=UPI0011AD3A29|nr:hypothetical protein [Micromonospora endolithica]TWJ24784.1 hypothetical protein JD76_04940 [Micromonospora endolithica]